MKAGIWMVVVLMGAMAGDVAAAENNASLAPLTRTPLTSQPDYILKECQEVSRIEPQVYNYFSPAAMLGDYLGRKSNRNIAYDPAVLATIKVTPLEGAKRGEMSVVNGSYFYEPTPDYLGKDKVTFMAEFEGKHYEIVVELHVLINVMENMPTSCFPPKLIKVNGKSVSGSSR